MDPQHQLFQHQLFQQVMDELGERFPSPYLDEYDVTPHGTEVLLFPRPYYYEPLMYLEIPSMDAKYLSPQDVFTIGYLDEGSASGTLAVYWHRGYRTYRIMTLTLAPTSHRVALRVPFPTGILRQIN